MKKSGRYKTSHWVEDQYEPGSHGRVLKNLLGIKSKAKMDRVEAVALKQMEDILFRGSEFVRDYQFTSGDICRIHEIWLGNIYPWAGRYRPVDLIKSNFRFPHAKFLPQLMETFEKEVLRKHTPCLFDSEERILQALAEVHTELALIHPFREGNGRIARALATLMALQAGYPLLNFQSLQGRGNRVYIAAIHAGLDKNYTPMKEIFGEILRK